MTTRLPDIAVLDAVGELLGRELLARDARLKALEDRPPPAQGDKGEKGERGEKGEPGPAGDSIKGDKGDKGELGEKGEQGEQGVQGIPGESVRGEQGQPGKDGAAGLGVDSPVWVTGVHREGAIVQHHIGQHFKALRDTASEPPGDDWQRLGRGGFRVTGGFSEQRTYLDGDLFTRDFGQFLHFNGEAHLLAGRGGKGDAGQRGLQGDPGRDGKDGHDGAVLHHVEVRGSTLMIVQRTPNGSLFDMPVDLMPFLEATAFALQDKFAQQLQELRDDMENRIAKALEKPARGRNGAVGHQPPRDMP